MRTLIVIAAVLAATSAHAQQVVKQFQLVGFTTSTVTGDAGVIGMTDVCQAEVGGLAVTLPRFGGHGTRRHNTESFTGYVTARPSHVRSQ